MLLISLLLVLACFCVRLSLAIDGQADIEADIDEDQQHPNSKATPMIYTHGFWNAEHASVIPESTASDQPALLEIGACYSVPEMDRIDNPYAEGSNAKTEPKGPPHEKPGPKDPPHGKPGPRRSPAPTYRPTPSRGARTRGPTYRPTPSRGARTRRPTYRPTPSRGVRTRRPTYRPTPSRGARTRRPTYRPTPSRGVRTRRPTYRPTPSRGVRTREPTPHRGGRPHKPHHHSDERVHGARRMTTNVTSMPTLEILAKSPNPTKAPSPERVRTRRPTQDSALRTRQPTPQRGKKTLQPTYGPTLSPIQEPIQEPTLSPIQEPIEAPTLRPIRTARPEGPTELPILRADANNGHAGDYAAAFRKLTKVEVSAERNEATLHFVDYEDSDCQNAAGSFTEVARFMNKE